MTNKDKEYFDDVRREIEKARKAIENKYLGRYAHTEATHRITENALFTLFVAEYAIEAYKQIFDNMAECIGITKIRTRLKYLMTRGNC